MAEMNMDTDLPAVIEDYKQALNQNITVVVNNLQNVTNISMNSLADGVDDSADKITKSTAGLSSIAGTAFQGIAKGALNAASGFLNIAGAGLSCGESFTSSMDGLAQASNGLLGSVMAPIADGIANTLLPMATESIGLLGSAFEEGGLEGMLEAGASIISNLATGLSENMPMMIETFISMINGFIPIIQENLPIIIEAGMLMLSSLIEGIGQMLPSLIEMAITLIVTLVEGLSSQLPTLIPIAISAIITLLTALIENLPMLIQAGIDLLMALIEGFVNAMPLLIEKLPELIMKIITAIIENLPKILESGRTILTKLIEGLVECGPKLFSAALDLLDKMIKKFQETDWLKVGQDILKGIIDGMKDMVTWAINKVKEVCGDIFDGILGFFGIASPSKLLRDEVGKFLPMGIEVGFVNQIPKSMRHITSSLRMEMDNMKEVAYSSNYAKAFMPSTTSNREMMQSSVNYQVNQTINSAKTLSPSEIGLATENTIRRMKWAL